MHARYKREHSGDDAHRLLTTRGEGHRGPNPSPRFDYGRKADEVTLRAAIQQVALVHGKFKTVMQRHGGIARPRKLPTHKSVNGSGSGSERQRPAAARPVGWG